MKHQGQQLSHLCLTLLTESRKISVTSEVSAREHTYTFTARVARLTRGQTPAAATAGDAGDKEAAGGSGGEARTEERGRDPGFWGW